MQSFGVPNELRPGDLGTSATLALFLLLPRAPLADARQRDQRGDVLVPALRPREKRGGISVDDELRTDDRPHGRLARLAGTIGVPLDVRAFGVLHRRHRVDGE